MVDAKTSAVRAVAGFKAAIGRRSSVPFPAALAPEPAALVVGKGRDDLVFTHMRGGRWVTRTTGHGWLRLW